MPIQQNFSIEKKEAITYDPLPEDVYTVELIDLEIQEKPKYKNPNEKENVFAFTYGVVDDGEFRARRLWRNFVPTFLYIGKKGKNVLYQIVEAHLKRELSPEDEARLDSDMLNSFIGSQVRVVVKNNTSDGKTYSNIDSFLKNTLAKPSLTEEEKQIKDVKDSHETIEPLE